MFCRSFVVERKNMSQGKEVKREKVLNEVLCALRFTLFQFTSHRNSYEKSINCARDFTSQTIINVLRKD